ncbi:hypothetical protein DM01DRAFT_1335019 [Hesseltinella vesiculosa]|uniref:MYND-type domain-containing protein n=1 Tax=Hesseltinella vesiculosa TaxID=101127 RepID=A0A1X2GJV4_9FUNG|nr:hypothetical protein DM01DRAFT_1335019 [Hesseltinella vesiculosa]
MEPDYHSDQDLTSDDEGSASSTGTCGDRCHQLASQYRQILDQIMMIRPYDHYPWATDLEKKNQGELLVAIVEAVARLLLDHLDVPDFQASWFVETSQLFWRYAKWIKEDGPEGEYELAQRITIYHCRATIYQQERELAKARLYYRKCQALATCLPHQLLLQDQASQFIQDHPLLTLNLLSSPASPTSSSPPSLLLPSTSSSAASSSASSPLPAATLSSPLLSSYRSSLSKDLQASVVPGSNISSSTTLVSSSVYHYSASVRRPGMSPTPSSISLSSGSSIASVKSCGQCGLEKIAMPVCAKCKSQRYCSLKCMKSHQPAHALLCQKP